MCPRRAPAPCVTLRRRRGACEAADRRRSVPLSRVDRLGYRAADRRETAVQETATTTTTSITTTTTTTATTATKAADANGAVSAPSYALSVKVLCQVQAAATHESSPAVGTPSDGSSTGPSDAVDSDASGNPSHGSLDNQSSPLVPAHGSGFVWWLFSVSVIMGAAVLLIGAIVRDTIWEPPAW